MTSAASLTAAACTTALPATFQQRTSCACGKSLSISDDSTADAAAASETATTVELRLLSHLTPATTFQRQHRRSFSRDKPFSCKLPSLSAATARELRNCNSSLRGDRYATDTIQRTVPIILCCRSTISDQMSSNSQQQQQLRNRLRFHYPATRGANTTQISCILGAPSRSAFDSNHQPSRSRSSNPSSASLSLQQHLQKPTCVTSARAPSRHLLH
jgi:hypothetical protein